ncbi:MAG: aminopeptidase-like protein [Clostridium sp.]
MLKNKTLILVLLLFISIVFNGYLFNGISKNNTQQITNNDIKSQLSFLGASLGGLKRDDNLRFMTSTIGSVFWLSRSSNNIDGNTTELFQELTNLFINSDVDKIYKNKITLSQLINTLATTPNDKKTKMSLRNLINTLN